MLNVLINRTFRHMFAAQLIALVGTGFATVALGLLAGANAGLVLGTALAIKMIAYVTLAPVAAALAERLPRRAFLVALDLVRSVVVLFLPFFTEVWQVYVLIFLLQAASAGFTPAFQATIPDGLPDERDYTNARSLLRLTEDVEQLISPMLAAALLTLVSFPVLFGGLSWDLSFPPFWWPPSSCWCRPPPKPGSSGPAPPKASTYTLPHRAYGG